MKIFLLFFVAVGSLLNFGEAYDYCSWDYTYLCRSYYRELTLCGAEERFYGACPQEHTRLVEFSEIKLLDFINHKRQEVATQRPASQMHRLQWCKELAKVAEHSVRLCNPHEEFCPKTVRFPHARIYTREYSYDKDKTIDISALNKFWEAYQKAYLNETKHFIDPKDTEGYAYFVHDQSTHVGCAASRYTLGNADHKFLYACAFSHSPSYSRLYEEGSPASECPSGDKDKEYKGLCVVAEDEAQRVSDFC